MVSKALESPVVQVASASPLVVTIPDPVKIEFPGPGLILSGTATSTPGVPQTLIMAIPTAGKTWKLRRVEMISRAYGAFYVTINAVKIKEGKTSPTETTVSLPVEPWKPATSVDTIELVYSQDTSPALPVIARIYYTEE